MPSEDRSATRRIEVEYADALSMTRAQLSEFEVLRLADSRVEVQVGRKMVSTAAAAYWTEHSPRPTLASWVSCLAIFPANWPDLLGRWGACKAEGYVRTHRKRVHLMQEAVAEKFRTDPNPHVLFDEAALFCDLASFLDRKGVQELEAQEVIRNLVIRGAFEESADTKGLAAQAPAVVLEDSDEEVVPLVKVSNHEEVQVEELQGKYVVSIFRDVRRLHRVGNCYRIPGKDYANFEVLGDVEPDACLYTCRCGHCWGKGRRLRTDEPSESSSSSSTSSVPST